MLTLNEALRGRLPDNCWPIPGFEWADWRSNIRAASASLPSQTVNNARPNQCSTHVKNPDCAGLDVTMGIQRSRQGSGLSKIKNEPPNQRPAGFPAG
jgi:hypothetical protein